MLPAVTRYRIERRVRGWFEHRRLLEADYVVVSFGKSGRTWLRVMLSRLYHLEHGLRGNTLLEFDNLHKLDAAIPRILFTHDNYLRDYTGDRGSKAAYRGKRVILLLRHPADVAISLYFQWRHRMRPHKIRLNDYPAPGSALEPYDFMMGGSGLPKVIRFMNEWANGLETPAETLLLRYEDLRTRTTAELARVAAFLRSTTDDTVIAGAVEYASFENMRRREAATGTGDGRLQPTDRSNPDSFKARRAKVGGYRDYFTGEQCAAIDRLIGNTLDARFGYRPAAPPPAHGV